jgi:hypothetical protein
MWDVFALLPRSAASAPFFKAPTHDQRHQVSLGLMPRFFHTRHALGAPPASTVHVSPDITRERSTVAVVEQWISS